MAPSESLGGAGKYNDLPLKKLQDECKTRGIDFDANANIEDLMLILLKDDNKGPDWADVFTELMCHSSVSYFDIHEMTIPVIQAIRGKLGKNIKLKVSMPDLFGSAEGESIPVQDNTGKPPKLSRLMDFANAFN